MEQRTQSFSAEGIIAVWEAGRQQHEVDRALTLLAAGASESSRDTLASLTISERDARLLRLRSLVFGPAANGFAECPECGERIELSIDIAALAEERTPARPPNVPATYEMETNGTRVRFRIPTSRDLTEVVSASDASDGLRRLIGRCIIEADPPNELSSEGIEALACAMLKADPQAELTLAFSCPSRGHRSEMLFDIAYFFWNEIAAEARRIIREIDALARAYGWSEREILTLSPRRRQSYLELIAA